MATEQQFRSVWLIWTFLLFIKKLEFLEFQKILSTLSAKCPCWRFSIVELEVKVNKVSGDFKTLLWNIFFTIYLLYFLCVFGVNIVKHKIMHQDQGISNWIFVEFMDLVKDKAVKETEMETINNVVLKRTKHNYGHTGKLLNEMIKYNRINLKFQLKSMLCWQKIDHQTDENYLQKQNLENYLWPNYY